MLPQRRYRAGDASASFPRSWSHIDQTPQFSARIPEFEQWKDVGDFSTHTRLCARRQTVLRRRGAVLFGLCGQERAISNDCKMQCLRTGIRTLPIFRTGACAMHRSICNSWFWTIRTEYTSNSISDAYGRYTAQVKTFCK